MSQPSQAEIPQQQAWVTCVASVVFDIDQGQRLESLHPENSLSSAEARDVAFHSFPDSMSMELHSRSSIRDSTFFFRIKRRDEDADNSAGGNGRAENGSQASTSGREHYHNQKQEFLYGFVFCRQRQDSRLKRGGEQKSLVLLAQQPWSGVLSQVSQWAGPLYFNQGSAALPLVYDEITAWDPPTAVSRQTVRAGNLTLIAQVPHPLTLPPPAQEEEPQQLAQESLEEVLPPLDAMAGVFAEVDLYTPLKAVLERAWALWEVSLLGEPLMVASPSPGECSRAVAALLALISPLPYSADFRPYFTIHDSAFQQLSGSQPAASSNGLPRLLGITNLYFLKALPKWPNVLSTGSKPAAEGGAEGSGRESRLARLEAVVRRRATGPHTLLARHTEALWLAYKPLTRPDKELLERLLQPASKAGPDRLAHIATANSAALRRHFGQLTAALLQPFDRFMQPVAPPPGGEPLPPGVAPHLPAFSHAAFLEGLQKEEPPPLLLKCFSNRGACVNFYRRFLESPNFLSWFERRRGRAAAWQEAVWTQARLERGTELELERSTEVHLVEAFGELERRLAAATAEASLPDAPPQVQSRMAALQKQVSSVYQRMPRDLQTCILSSPSRAALLHRLNPSVRVPGQPKILTPGEEHSEGGES